jgi:hypothetical protein
VLPESLDEDVVRVDWLPPGRFELTVRWRGRERTVTVDMRPGEIVEVALDP